MSYQLSYEADGRLVISGLECGCPCEHNEPAQDIYVGSGVLDNIARCIRRRNLGDRCVLVADNITWEVAGRRTFELLTADGFNVTPCVIRRDAPMEPDERAVGEVFLTITADTQFLVSVGSGSITDTVRVNAKRIGLPMVCVGTAASMDGYTSSVCPLTLRGIKIHREGKCPEIIICDLDVLRTAPMEMVCSGVGDVLGKYIAKVDWIIGSIINDEAYCPTCGEIVTDAVNKLVENVDEIRSRSEKGMRILIEALLLAGITIMIIGHTRAVASVEHNIAHYWEMMQMMNGRKAPQHGAAVGVATLLVWPLFTRFAQEDLSKLDLQALKAKRQTRAEREKWLVHAYGEEAAASIIRENECDFLTWEEQERRIRRAQERFDQIRECIASLPPLEDIRGAMARLGAQMTPADCGVEEPLLNLSMHCAKDYRSRYTLFKTLDECGLLEEYLKDYPIDWQA